MYAKNLIFPESVFRCLLVESQRLTAKMFISQERMTSEMQRNVHFMRTCKLRDVDFTGQTEKC